MFDNIMLIKLIIIPLTVFSIIDESIIIARNGLNCGIGINLLIIAMQDNIAIIVMAIFEFFLYTLVGTPFNIYFL